MSEAESKLASEMSAEEELRMRVSGKPLDINVSSSEELRDVSHYPDEDRERDVMGAYAPSVITGGSVFIASETGDVTPKMASCLLSHETMHHILLVEVGIEASRKYDRVADDYHDGFEQKARNRIE
jgi:hypothetical protein